MCKSADPWCRSASRVVAGRRRMPSERIAKHLSERAPTSAGIPATLSLNQKYVRRNRPISGQKSRKYISSGGNRFNPDKMHFDPVYPAEIVLTRTNRCLTCKNSVTRKKFVTREKPPEKTHSSARSLSAKMSRQPTH